MTPRRFRASTIPILVLLLLALAAPWAPARAQAKSAAAMSQGQLDAVLAPVALYPDALLTPLLMATTYPDEMTAADDWLQKSRNARLRGDALAAALAPLPWDPSVKALLPFPQLLDILANRPVWMHQIGDAFLADPAAVMREIQRLRRVALATGKLKSTPRLMVTDAGGQIMIASADPAVVYIPVYNPGVVYGAWAYPAYPPVYVQPPPGFHASGPGMETGIGFSLGFAVVHGLWGWAHPDWATGAVTIDIALYNRINRYGAQASSATWHHEPHSAGYFHIPAAEAATAAGEHATATGHAAEAKHGRNHAAARHETRRTRGRPHHAARHARGKPHRKSGHARPSHRPAAHGRSHHATPAHRHGRTHRRRKQHR